MEMDVARENFSSDPPHIRNNFIPHWRFVSKTEICLVVFLHPSVKVEIQQDWVGKLKKVLCLKIWIKFKKEIRADFCDSNLEGSKECYWLLVPHPPPPFYRTEIIGLKSGSSTRFSKAFRNCLSNEVMVSLKDSLSVAQNLEAHTLPPPCFKPFYTRGLFETLETKQNKSVFYSIINRATVLNYQK